MQIPKELKKKLFNDRIYVLDRTRQTKNDFLIERKRREKLRKEDDLQYIRDIIIEGYQEKIKNRRAIMKKKMVELFGTTFKVHDSKVSNIIMEFNELEEVTGKSLLEIRYSIFQKKGWQKLPFDFKKILNLYKD